MVDQELSVTPHRVHIHPADMNFSLLIKNKNKNDYLLVMCHNACNSQTEDVGLCTLMGGNRNFFFNDFTNILMLNFKTEKTANFPRVTNLFYSVCLQRINM